MFNQTAATFDLFSTRATHLAFRLLMALGADHFLIADVEATKNEITSTFFANEAFLVPALTAVGHSLLADGYLFTTSLTIIGEMCCMAAQTNHLVSFCCISFLADCFFTFTTTEMLRVIGVVHRTNELSRYDKL